MKSDSKNTVISADNLKHSFGSLEVLKGVSFKVSRGEVFGLLGANGAGKTTLMRILYGNIRPISGCAEVLGLNPSDSSDLEGLRRRIGVMNENAGHYERLSVLTNLKFFAEIFECPEPKKRADELLSLVGLESKAKERVSSLSKGMKQRLAFARALAGNPELLFLDEPTAGLDPNSAVRFRELIKKYCEGGGSVFLNTHYLEEAEDLCTCTAILDKGCIVCCGHPLDLCRQYLPEQIEVIKGGRKVMQPPGLGHLFAHFTNRNIDSD